MCFTKAAVVADVHFGKKSNSEQFNADNAAFFTWMCEKAKEEGCDTFIFLGDWYHSQSAINIQTMRYSEISAQIISSTFKKCKILLGNHDIYFKNHSDVDSLGYLETFENFHVIKQPYVEDGCVFIPWHTDWNVDEVKSQRGDFVFGHLEMSGFLQNELIECKRDRNLSAGELRTIAPKTYMGHFHKRQTENGLTYVGSPFPHDFNDVNDDDRGFLVLSYDGTEKWFNWDGGPRYRRAKLSELASNPSAHIVPKAYVEVEVDIDLTYEQEISLRKTLIDTYQLRSIQFRKPKIEITSEIPVYEGEIKTTETIVLEGLEAVENSSIDPKILVEIWSDC